MTAANTRGMLRKSQPAHSSWALDTVESSLTSSAVLYNPNEYPPRRYDDCLLPHQDSESFRTEQEAGCKTQHIRLLKQITWSPSGTNFNGQRTSRAKDRFTKVAETLTLNGRTI